MVGDAGKVDPPAAKLNEELRIHPPQEDRVDGKEVAGHNPGRLLAQERPPVGCGASGRRVKTASAQNPPDRAGHSYGSVIGPPGSQAAARSPFVNGTLARDCGLATNYHNVSQLSLENYLAATVGSTLGVVGDCLPRGGPQGTRSLFDEVRAAGMAWRSYQESAPRPCHATTRWCTSAGSPPTAPNGTCRWAPPRSCSGCHGHASGTLTTGQPPACAPRCACEPLRLRRSAGRRRARRPGSRSRTGSGCGSGTSA
jgi:hypothetical protein